MENTGIKLNYQDYTICNKKPIYTHRYARKIVMTYANFRVQRRERKNEKRNGISPIRTLTL